MKPLVRILAVVRQPEALQDLANEMRRTQPGWILEFAENPSRALQRIAHKNYDAVISDLGIPSQSGLDFLQKVRERCPDVLRIIWTSHASWQLGLQLLGLVHQHLTRADSPAVLIEHLQSSLSVGHHLKSAALRRIIGQVQSLPSIPALYFELLQVLRAPDSDANNVAAIISRDLAMTAKMLKLANSPFFGLDHQITNPVEAVIQLGVETVERLVLLIQIFSLFKNVDLGFFSTERLWSHSWDCGRLARRVAELEQHSTEAANLITTAGLLHDVGKLLLATAFAHDFQQALNCAHEQNIPLWQAEQNVFGASHADVGAFLLSLWGLPDRIVEAVLRHHQPGACSSSPLCPAGCVHLANALANTQTTPSLECVQKHLVPEYQSRHWLVDPAQVWKFWIHSG